MKILEKKKIDIVLKIARQAGEILLRHYNGSVTDKVWHKKHNEAVSSADIASDKFIIKELQKNFPGDEILTEESGDIGSAAGVGGANVKSERLWVIDPLDGTSNFLHKNPIFGVNIALAEHGKIIFGVTYLPVSRELFWAIKGKGAWLNGKLIYVSKTKKLKDALVNACYGHDPKYKRRDYHVAREVDKHSRFTRRPGAACFELATVAMGGSDATYILGTRPWDSAPGSLIVTEAGGVATNLKGEPWKLFDENIVVSNGKIHIELLKLLK